jgi:hypothetical protein
MIRKASAAAEAGLGTRNAADFIIIERWEEWPFEKDWRQIHRRAPQLAPAEFIRTTLSARRSAAVAVTRFLGTRLPARSDYHDEQQVTGFKKEGPVVLRHLKRHLRITLKATSSPQDVVSALDDATTYVLGLYLSLPAELPFTLSRQGSHRERERRAFWEMMAEYFQKECGGKLSPIIAALSEIAFPSKGTDATDVDDWLKRHKPTKQRKRRTRR